MSLSSNPSFLPENGISSSLDVTGKEAEIYRLHVHFRFSECNYLSLYTVIIGISCGLRTQKIDKLCDIYLDLPQYSLFEGWRRLND